MIDDRSAAAPGASGDPATMSTPDEVERVGRSLIQHGPFSDRIYLMSLDPGDLPALTDQLLGLARERGYGKIIARIPSEMSGPFTVRSFQEEARIPDLFGPGRPGVFLARFLDPARNRRVDQDELDRVLALARAAGTAAAGPDAPATAALSLPPGLTLREGRTRDVDAFAGLYHSVFRLYPFPIQDPAHLRDAISHGTRFFGIWDGDELVAASAMEPGHAPEAVEMTDFATRPSRRGSSLSTHLLTAMDEAARAADLRTAYTIARAVSPGMNITFARRGYRFAGRLVNNTRIGQGLETMNVWYRPVNP